MALDKNFLSKYRQALSDLTEQNEHIKDEILSPIKDRNKRQDRQKQEWNEEAKKESGGTAKDLQDRFCVGRTGILGTTSDAIGLGSHVEP